MKKNFLVIGGGMSGCATAIYLSNNGFDVTICEKMPSLGGVTKDITFPKEIFLSGPHYLKSNSFLVSELKKEKLFDKILNESNYLYGSFTDIFNKKIYNSYFAHPVTEGNFDIQEINKPFYSLKDRLDCYPNEISQKLKNWSKIFDNDIDLLHHNCTHPMGISRIYLKDEETALKKQKKKNIYIDEIFGIPNFEYRQDKFFLPANGYDFFFLKLQDILKEKKIKINLNSKLKIKMINSKLNFEIDKKKSNFDFIVWAANPVPLFKLLGLGKIDNPIAKVKTISSNLLDQTKKYESQYYQIFSSKSNILRFFIYHLNGKNKLSIELSINQNKIDINEELKFVNDLLEKFNINSKFDDKIYETKQIRHIFYTMKDFEKFQKFEKISKKFNVISGGWHLIGSDNKIKYIQKKIDEIIAN